MEIPTNHISQLSGAGRSALFLDGRNQVIYLMHSCLWFSFSEDEFRSFVQMINHADYEQHNEGFPFGMEGVLFRSPLPGIGFRFEKDELAMLKAILNKAIFALNYRTILN